MEGKTEINVGGVPEHFNRPWHMAREQNMWEAANISVSAGVVVRIYRALSVSPSNMPHSWAIHTTPTTTGEVA